MFPPPHSVVALSQKNPKHKFVTDSLLENNKFELIFDEDRDHNKERNMEFDGIFF